MVSLGDVYCMQKRFFKLFASVFCVAETGSVRIPLWSSHIWVPRSHVKGMRKAEYDSMIEIQLVIAGRGSGH